ncbi:argonaute-like protein [Pluteus cervinus]|uniref:Argonaute-like protein n=1 Tax=Pluteus cervinus TaxID=181527 RepID=A0ACD3BE14_9AGAR|nr:argonaute-like protein [Pluteus cervinus]
MPPRGRGVAPRRGQGASRGGSPGRGASRGSGVQTRPAISEHITTVGVKRPDFGTDGASIEIYANAFSTTIPQHVVHHYDVIYPVETVLPARVNMDLIKRLQADVAPQVFTPRAVYDGRKNLFALRELPFPDGSQEACLISTSIHRPLIVLIQFEVPAPNAASGRPPKMIRIRLNKVAEINPEILRRFIAGDQSHDSAVTTALTVLNVVVRMEPNLRYPSNLRSFFTPTGSLGLRGTGLELWRGYFQSVRPSIGKMLINIDISTATMYRPGPLLELCREFLGIGDPAALSPNNGLSDRERLRLQRFLLGIRVWTSPEDKAREKARTLKKLSSKGANQLDFEMREGGKMTVAQYFRQQNRVLRYPNVICIEVGNGAYIPLELCEVPPGQMMRKQIPANKTREITKFATQRPSDRLKSIQQGLQVLAYGQSEYVRGFGMSVDQNILKFNARVLRPPVLRYGPTSKSTTITPSDGKWNMTGKHFYKATEIVQWCILVFETEMRFPAQQVKATIDGLVQNCREVGIKMQETKFIRWANAQGAVTQQLNTSVSQCYNVTKKVPQLIVIILPEGGDDIYTAVKHFGDIAHGIPTQCMKSKACVAAGPQYFANVSLKINVKLGGINVVPNAERTAPLPILGDVDNPTIIFGADVIHPAPGSEGVPSFTALVASVDNEAAKYIAASSVQGSRQEIIADLKEMSKDLLVLYQRYRERVERRSPNDLKPKRIIFYRDGVSEGQFQQVLDKELASLKEACRELNIDAKITFVVVGKRHHIRFFPVNPKDADRSGNCPAGTVIDREITHPTEFDFYLQSHGGLLGTSKPAHYSVLHDENNFSSDAIQRVSFNLCHVYARSTRSVSIPAPVYYADIVCSRAKNHYSPEGSVVLSETGTRLGSERSTSLDLYKREYRKLHQNQRILMYFS